MELPGQGYGWGAWGTPGMGAGGGGLWPCRPRLGVNSSVFLQGPPQGGLGGGAGGLGKGLPGKNIAGWAGAPQEGTPWAGDAVGAGGLGSGLPRTAAPTWVACWQPSSVTHGPGPPSSPAPPSEVPGWPGAPGRRRKPGRPAGRPGSLGPAAGRGNGKRQASSCVCFS